MKEFFRIMKRYTGPYRGCIGGAVVLNLLSAVFNVFSFAVLIPILNILFKIDTTEYSYIAPGTEGLSAGDILANNAYWRISTFAQDHGAGTALLILCAVMIVFTILKTSCYFGSNAVMIPIRTGIVRDLRNSLYDKILSLPAGYFTEKRKGDITARISGDVSEVETSITASIEMLIKDPILIITYFLVILRTSPEMTAFTVVFVPPIVWIMGVIGRRLRRKSSEAQALWSDTMSQVDETLDGIRIIKAFNAQGRMSSRFRATTGRMRDRISRVGVRQALAHPVSELLGTIMIMAVLSFGGMMIIRGRGLFGGAFMDASRFIFFLVILYSMIEPIKELAKAAYSIPRGLASMERIEAVLTESNPISEKPGAMPVSTLEHGIRYERVSFSYDGETPVLEDIDLEIPKGRTVAIVGESGAGKSTIADLLPRLWDVTGGRILIDGTDIRDLRIRDLRSLMGIVDQDPILFNDTIFNNIAFGSEGAAEEEVIAAAKAAGAHDFIVERPGGYRSMVGDRGSRLSGGQRQRISIARAILRNPPILILDEATASLDNQSEKQVQEALSRLMSSRTTIAIAHRLSTVRDADRIVVLHEGRIVESGTHESLKALGGYYSKLYGSQEK